MQNCKVKQTTTREDPIEKISSTMKNTASMRSSKIRSLLVLMTVMVSACVSPRPRVDPTGPPDTIVQIGLPDGGGVVTLPLERYVIGSVLAEADFRGLDQDSARRVAEVQSILARTYALANAGRHSHEGFQLCATTHCQVYRPAEQFPDAVTALVIESSRATAGLVMSYDGRPINAVYHADCGGGTSDASVPWGGSVPPYLRGIADSFCIRDDPTPWRFEGERSAVLLALDADDRTSVGSEIAEIQVIEQDPAGRAVQVRLRGIDGQSVTVRGETFRSALVAGFGQRSIKSTRFSIIDAGDHFVVEGRGFGHGVGLCQRGAAARARDRHSPNDILTHYYPGARLTRYH